MKITFSSCDVTLSKLSLSYGISVTGETPQVQSTTVAHRTPRGKRASWNENHHGDIVLWIPYFLIFITLFNNLLPFNDPADVPSPGAGIMLMFSIFFYPFYVATIIGIGMGFDAAHETN